MSLFIEACSVTLFNHAGLGFCVLVNTDMSPGRQAFSLAHLYAHTLYHFAERGAVCRFEDDSSQERFAHTFAPHFLIPRKRLRKMIGVAAGSSVDAYAAVYLAHYFRVSYPTTLHCLLTERHITEDEYEKMKSCSASALAEKIGLDPRHFRPADPTPLALERYPMSVLKGVRESLKRGALQIDGAADLLDVSEEIIYDVLLSELPEATRREMEEFYELPR